MYWNWYIKNRFQVSQSRTSFLKLLLNNCLVSPHITQHPTNSSHLTVTDNRCNHCRRSRTIGSFLCVLMVFARQFVQRAKWPRAENNVFQHPMLCLIEASALKGYLIILQVSLTQSSVTKHIFPCVILNRDYLISHNYLGTTSTGIRQVLSCPHHKCGSLPIEVTFSIHRSKQFGPWVKDPIALP